MDYKAPPIMLFSALNEFEEISAEIKSSTKLWLSEHSSDKPLILHHYTTLEGLKGVITDRAIRSTQINQLNDPFELQYGRMLILDIINDYIEKEKEDNVRLVLKELADQSKYSGQSPSHVLFITSFCKNDNLLSQWRGYAARGGGYNLGIAFDSATKLCSDINNHKDNKPIILRKVIYDPATQTSFIKQYIENIIKGIKNASPNWNLYLRECGPSLISQIALSAVNILVDMMLSMKNPAFKVEEEWRMIRKIRFDEIPEHFKFRENNNELIPYLNTYLFKEINSLLEFPLEKIRFGPMLDKIKTRIALDLFIRNSATLTKSINIKTGISIDDAGFVIR